MASLSEQAGHFYVISPPTPQSHPAEEKFGDSTAPFHLLPNSSLQDPAQAPGPLESLLESCFLAPSARLRGPHDPFPECLLGLRWPQTRRELPEGREEHPEAPRASSALDQLASSVSPTGWPMPRVCTESLVRSAVCGVSSAEATGGG